MYEVKDDPQKTFRLVMGKEHITRPIPCKICYDYYGYYYDDDDDVDDISYLNVCNPEWLQR